MRAKTYARHQETCCMATLENCTVCSEKDHCFVLKEQLAFSNRLGISQIDDDIDADSLSSIRYL